MDDLLKWIGSIAGALALLSWFLVNRELTRLGETNVEVLQNAGIKRVDWWFGCFIGVFRLAFGSAGADLTRRQRGLFRLMWIASIIAIALLGTAGRIEQG